jgi:hypothetical protein
MQARLSLWKNSLFCDRNSPFRSRGFAVPKTREFSQQILELTPEFGQKSNPSNQINNALYFSLLSREH